MFWTISSALCHRAPSFIPGFLNPIKQVSEINYQYFKNCFDKFLNLQGEVY